MFELWLSLHVLGAIVAFGFGFAAPIFGAAVAREPQHGNWYLRAVRRVSDVLIVPVALSMAVTGLLLVMETGGLARLSELWLALALVIYVGALAAVFLAQRPALSRVIELTSAPPGPEGPPAEVPALIERLKTIGIGLTVAITAIVLLMVFRPTL